MDVAPGLRKVRFPVLLIFLAVGGVQADDWPQWGGPKRDGIWREAGITRSIPETGLKMRWRVRVSNGYSGPAVAEGRVFVTDRILHPDRERVLCFNEADGKKLWEHEYRCEYADMEYGNGPRATPTVHDGKVYTFGTKGHLVCLDAGKGTVIWRKDLVKEYQAEIPRYGSSAAPIVEGDLLIAHVGGKPGAMMVAFDRNTGEERWRSLGDRAAYSAPIVIERGGARQLIAWTGDAVNSLSPRTGRPFWRVPFKCGWDVAETIGTPVLNGNHLLFVKGWSRGALLLDLATDKPNATEKWRTRSEPSTMMATPYFIGSDHFISINGQRGLSFHSVADARQIWADRSAIGDARLGFAHATPHDDRLFIFNQSGHLIVGRATTNGFDRLGETLLVEPTPGYRAQGPVVWTHPAYANRSVYARNDRELVCASLASEDYEDTRSLEAEEEFDARVLSKFIGMSAARSLAFSPDGSQLAVGTMIGTVRWVDVGTGEAPPEPRRRGRRRNQSYSADWSRDGNLVAVAGGTEFRQSSNNEQTSGYVRLWNAAERKELPELVGLSNNVLSVAFSPNSRFIAIGDADNRVRLFAAKTGKLIHALAGHRDAVSSVAFSPDGDRILSTGWDRTLRVWDGKSGKQLAELRGHDDEIRSLAVSSDGRFAATGSADWTVRLWDLEARQTVAVLKGHNGGVYCLAFSSDGKRLFSGSGDETVRVWDVPKRRSIATLRGHRSGVRALSLSADDRTLATTGTDDALRIWRLKRSLFEQ